MAAEVHTISFKPVQNFATPYFSWENSEKLVLGVFHPFESDFEIRFAKIFLKKAESRLLCLIVHNCIYLNGVAQGGIGWDVRRDRFVLALS
jgi:hypothetical protein